MRTSAPRKPYEFLEHTADIRLRASGTDLSELFTNCALGMMEYLFSETIHDLRPSTNELIEIFSTEREVLLVDWLSALLCRSATRSVAFVGFDFEQISDTHLVNRAASSAAIAQKEIKAVTHYDLKFELSGGLWQVTVTFDI
jgi:SHS2 domain-containing protein